MQQQVKMKKTIITTILVLLMIFITGCGQTQQVPNYYTGFAGITMAFSKTMPPSEVYEGTKSYPNVIPIALEIANVGAYSVTNDSKIHLKIWHNGRPFLSGLGDYAGTNKIYNANLQLRGRSTDWPNGESKYLALGRILNISSLSSLFKNSNKQDVDVFATACYPYQTTLTQSICIDADIYHTQNNPICRNQPVYTLSAGQGAPIAITKIESEMVPFTGTPDQTQLTILDFSGDTPIKKTINSENSQGVQPSFNIYIENKGKGKADVKLKSDDKDTCDSAKGFLGIDKVKVTADIAGVPLVCNPEILELQQNAYTTCYFGKGYLINSNYENILNINVTYDYQDTITKKMTIKRLPSGLK